MKNEDSKTKSAGPPCGGHQAVQLLDACTFLHVMHFACNIPVSFASCMFCCLVFLHVACGLWHVSCLVRHLVCCIRAPKAPSYPQLGVSPGSWVPPWNLSKIDQNMPYFSRPFLTTLGLHFGAFWLPKWLQN